MLHTTILSLKTSPSNNYMHLPCKLRNWRFSIRHPKHFQVEYNVPLQRNQYQATIDQAVPKLATPVTAVKAGKLLVPRAVFNSLGPKFLLSEYWAVGGAGSLQSLTSPRILLFGWWLFVQVTGGIAD